MGSDSPRQLQWATHCGIKRAFADAQGAEEFYQAKKEVWRHRKPGRINAYKCELCGLFHLGHSQVGMNARYFSEKQGINS